MLVRYKTLWLWSKKVETCCNISRFHVKVYILIFANLVVLSVKLFIITTIRMWLRVHGWAEVVTKCLRQPILCLYFVVRWDRVCVGPLSVTDPIPDQWILVERNDGGGVGGIKVPQVNLVLVPFCLLQITHGLPWEQTPTSAMKFCTECYQFCC